MSSVGRIALPDTSSNQKTRDFWSRQAPPTEATGGYLYSPVTRPYILETAFGQEVSERYRDSPTWGWDILFDRYLPRHGVRNVLSLCCGFGHAERIAMSRLPEAQCLALDIAPGAIDVARRLAAEAGIANVRYEVASLDEYEWKPEQYDLVIANGALHHLTNLEVILPGIRNALRPGGVLVSSEFVGPNYQDHSPRQIELINAASFLVPRELRSRTGLSWQSHPRIFRALTRLHMAAARDEQPGWAPWKKRVAKIMRSLLSRPAVDFGMVHISPKDHLLRTDPSECIRSADVVPALKTAFPDAEILPMGGGLLEFCLDPKFYEKFDFRNDTHVADFHLLCELERHYMRTGEIGSDFAYMVARK